MQSLEWQIFVEEMNLIKQLNVRRKLTNRSSPNQICDYRSTKDCVYHKHITNNFLIFLTQASGLFYLLFYWKNTKKMYGTLIKTYGDSTVTVLVTDDNSNNGIALTELFYSKSSLINVYLIKFL